MTIEFPLEMTAVPHPVGLLLFVLQGMFNVMHNVYYRDTVLEKLAYNVYYRDTVLDKLARNVYYRDTVLDKLAHNVLDKLAFNVYYRDTVLDKLAHNVLDKLAFNVYYRDTVLDKLAQQDIGSFVVRDSTTHAGCYALSIRIDKHDAADHGISHYLITKTPRGTVKLKVRQQSLSIFLSAIE